jgi:branched-subunit amino acid ABC-type transport system permease component
MLGAFGAYFLTTQAGLSFLPAVALTFALAVAGGAVLEWGVLKPFRRDELNGMIATIGLAMILQNVALMFFGPDPLSMPAVAQGTARLGKVVVPLSRIYGVAFALLAFTGFCAIPAPAGRCGRWWRISRSRPYRASAPASTTRWVSAWGSALPPWPGR